MVIVHVPARALLRRRRCTVVQIPVSVSVVEMNRVAGVGMRLRFRRRVEYGRTAICSLGIRRGYRRWACHPPPIAIAHDGRWFLDHPSVWALSIPVSPSRRFKAVSLDLELKTLLFQLELFRAPVYLSFSLTFAAWRWRGIILYYGRLAVMQRCAEREIIVG
jgi:hypothetical protein